MFEFVPPVKLSRHSNAFTLIELLATVAILGVLVILTLATTRHLLSAASETRCVNNLRQWGLLFNNYIHEHNGNFPLADPTLPNGWTVSWQHPMYELASPAAGNWPYTDWYMGKGIVGCPSRSDGLISPGLTFRYHSYLYNYAFGHQQSDIPPLNINRLKERQNLMVLVDAINTSPERTIFGLYLEDRVGMTTHGGKKFNALFADWHVTSSSLPLERENLVPDVDL